MTNLLNRLQTEILGVLSLVSFSGTTALALFEAINVYLQTAALLVSIVAGLAALHSWWKKREKKK